jgi:putative two-component system response regulator
MTHHEKWDGSGYPHGLSAESIPPEGRIVAIADVFDALSTDRPYKEAWPLEKILKYIDEQAGRHFDPQMVRLFNENLDAIVEIQKRYHD